MILTRNERLLPMMNNVDALNPTESNRKPLADGPTNAPKANVDVQRPEMSP